MSDPVVFCVQVHRARSRSQAHPGKGLPPREVCGGGPASRAADAVRWRRRRPGRPAVASSGPASCLQRFAPIPAPAALPAAPDRGAPELWLQAQLSAPRAPSCGSLETPRRREGSVLRLTVSVRLSVRASVTCAQRGPTGPT